MSGAGSLLGAVQNLGGLLYEEDMVERSNCVSGVPT